MAKNHIADEVCSCKYCQKIDVIFGDPLLNEWEKAFIDGVAKQGWHKEYSTRQKTVIDRIYKAQRNKYCREGSVDGA